MNINSRHILNFVKDYIKSLFTISLIFIVCFLPANEVDKISNFNFIYLDKIIHFSMFFTLSIVLFFEIKKPIRKIFLSVILVSLFLASFTEIIQHTLITSRSGDINDFFADMIGTFTAILFYYLKFKN